MSLCYFYIKSQGLSNLFRFNASNTEPPYFGIFINTNSLCFSNDFSILSLLFIHLSGVYIFQGILSNELNYSLKKKELCIFKEEITRILKFNDRFKNFYIHKTIKWISLKEFSFDLILRKTHTYFLISADHRNYQMNNLCFMCFFNLEFLIINILLTIENFWIGDLFLQNNIISLFFYLSKSKIFSSGILQFINQKNFKIAERDFWKISCFCTRFSKIFNSNLLIVSSIIKKIYI